MTAPPASRASVSACGRHLWYLFVPVLIAGACHNDAAPRSTPTFPTTTTTPVVQSGLSTALPPTLLAGQWERVEIDSRENSYFDASSVKVDGARLVASGSGPIGCCDTTTIAWESTDGRRWRPHELPEALDGQRFTGAHAKAGGVAVGDWITMADCKNDPQPCRPVAAAWWSDRAGGWHRVPDDPAVFGPARMEHVWKQPDGYMAVGYLLDDQEQPAAPMLWRSADGRRWRRQTPAGAVPVQASTVEIPRGIVALTGRQAWWSRDGLSWERSAILGDPNADINGAGWLHRAGGAALAVFEQLTPAKHHHLKVHWSADGRTWHAVDEPFGPPTTKPTYITSVRTLRHGIIAVGLHNGDPTLWESSDGRHWRRTPLTDPVFRDAWVSDITEIGDLTVLVGGVELPAGNKPRAQPIAWRRTNSD